MHDLEILIDRTRGVQSKLVAARSHRHGASSNKLVRALEDECREGHAVYMRGRDRHCVKLCDAHHRRRRSARPSAA